MESSSGQCPDVPTAAPFPATPGLFGPRGVTVVSELPAPGRKYGCGKADSKERAFAAADRDVMASAARPWCVECGRVKECRACGRQADCSRMMLRKRQEGRAEALGIDLQQASPQGPEKQNFAMTILCCAALRILSDGR